jgi:single-stranded DNA-binding protein
MEDKITVEIQKRTELYGITALGRLAEKGKQIRIEGRIQTKSWEKG